MEFTLWLQVELNKRGWDQAELARRSGITKAQISRVLVGERSAGVDFCIAIARALGLPREEVFRARGWLLREPDEIVPAGTNSRIERLIKHINTLAPEVQELLADSFEGIVKLVDPEGFAQVLTGKEHINPKIFLSEFATKVSRVGGVDDTSEDTQVDLSIFPEEDREIIGQLQPPFQEYLAALLKQGEHRYLEAMNYAKSGVDAEMKRLQQSENTLKKS